ncbi:MAG: hypothetical protein HC820_01440 [Hydrococcus sp. RM1_1_31]|nr:hypothetical protein [Hydrococcus sp. RM1_1_31]
MIHARFFQNIEQVKEALKAQLVVRENHLQHDMKTLKTNLALNSAITRFQGFEEGIKYAIRAIEDYQNTPRPLEDTAKIQEKK